MHNLVFSNSVCVYITIFMHLCFHYSLEFRIFHFLSNFLKVIDKEFFLKAIPGFKTRFFVLTYLGNWTLQNFILNSTSNIDVGCCFSCDIQMRFSLKHVAQMVIHCMMGNYSINGEDFHGGIILIINWSGIVIERGIITWLNGFIRALWNCRFTIILSVKKINQDTLKK